MSVGFIGSQPVQQTSGSSSGSGGGGGTTAPPKKYVMIDGVMQINPAWKEYKNLQGEATGTAKNPDQALAVVSNMEDAMIYQEETQAAAGYRAPLSEATNCTIQIMQEPDIYQEVGVSSGEALVDGLGAIFAKHEAPLGMMNKLMALQTLDRMEFIIDDSYSMNSHSDTFKENGERMTRWEEARSRMKEMLEVMSYVPLPREVEIRFLNRQDVVRLERSCNQTPQNFYEDAAWRVEQAMSRVPAQFDCTPLMRRLNESFARGPELSVGRYIFCDGEPNDYHGVREDVVRKLINRQDPQRNPVTLLSCTGQDEEVEWMKEAEEIAEYCAEYDDLSDEQDEVARDQGTVLPYTKGFHLIAQLVGAMNPDDLDAMDESVPFTKYTLDNLLGVQTNEKEYERYFSSFLEAQRTRQVQTSMDQIKKNFPWQLYLHLFRQGTLARDIPEVQEFKRQLKAVTPGA